MMKDPDEFDRVLRILNQSPSMMTTEVDELFYASQTLGEARRRSKQDFIIEMRNFIETYVTNPLYPQYVSIAKNMVRWYLKHVF